MKTYRPGFVLEMVEGVTELPPKIENIGWTLGNDCPFYCTHCYSTIVRTRGRNLSLKL